jgi:hypothetical protein
MFKIGRSYNLVISVFGRRGSGKTYLSSLLADQFKKIIVFDTRNRIGTKNEKFYDANIRGCEYVYSVEKLCDAFERGKPDRIIFKPSDPKGVFGVFCELCDCREVKDVLIFIDEIGLLTSSNHYDIDPHFNGLLRFGRHHNLFLLLTAQRPVDVNRSITAESSHIISFNQTETRDLGYFSGYFDVSILPKLKKYNFMCWKDTGEIGVYDEKQNEIKKDLHI